MATKNGNGQQALKTDPTAVAVKPQIPKRIRRFINEAFDAHVEMCGGSFPPDEIPSARDAVASAKKEVLAFINGLLKNQKPAG